MPPLASPGARLKLVSRYCRQRWVFRAAPPARPHGRSLRGRVFSTAPCPAGSLAEASRAAAPGEAAPHVPVLMREVLGAFEGRSLRRFFDGTLGGGGHATALLRAHPELELYLATDLDPAAHSVAEAALASASVPLVVRRCSDPEGGYLPTKDGTPRQSAQVLHGSFLAGAQALAAAEWTVDGALLDLGMSSMQLDAAGRGFAFGRDGPLDMRMDPGGALAASDIVNGWSEQDLGALIREYGEEPRWRALAQRYACVWRHH